ncbi:MAG: helix-turn-helix domain-containing protein [Chloroflexota bacterium]|nr:helix-turn-helix domain-containing protein [Chloroflexota bacterium]
MPEATPEGWVRNLRERSGLSQAAFARRLGVRQQTVSEWETGRYAPRGASLTVLRMLEEEIAPYDASPPAPEPEEEGAP